MPTAALQQNPKTVRILLPETNQRISISLTDHQHSNDRYSLISMRSNGITTQIPSRYGIIRIPLTKVQRKDQFIWAADTPGLRLDPTGDFLIGQYTTAGKQHMLLFFLSESYASDATPLLVIVFSSHGQPFKVFEREFEPSSFQQTDDGALLIGKETVSQGICIASQPGAPSASTYDPYSVFRLAPGSKAMYLPEASRLYNQKHYVWAGPKMREDFTVIRNLPGHPKIFGVSSAKAARLLAHMNCTP